MANGQGYRAEPPLDLSTPLRAIVRRIRKSGETTEEDLVNLLLIADGAEAEARVHLMNTATLVAVAYLGHFYAELQALSAEAGYREFTPELDRKAQVLHQLTRTDTSREALARFRENLVDLSDEQIEQIKADGTPARIVCGCDDCAQARMMAERESGLAGVTLSPGGDA